MSWMKSAVVWAVGTVLVGFVSAQSYATCELRGRDHVIKTFEVSECKPPGLFIYNYQNNKREFFLICYFNDSSPYPYRYDLQVYGEPNHDEHYGSVEADNPNLTKEISFGLVTSDFISLRVSCH